MKLNILIVQALLVFGFMHNTSKAQNSIDSSKIRYRGAVALYPLPNKPMLGYRGSIDKNRVLDLKFGFSYAAGSPQLFLEMSSIKRRNRIEAVNFYQGLGVTIEGFNPGVLVPLGFEIAPFEKHPNFIIVAETAPKLMLSLVGGFYAGLNGSIGVLLFKPRKKI